MSKGGKNTSSSSYKQLDREWLYKRPPLKVRTQPRIENIIEEEKLKQQELSKKNWKPNRFLNFILQRAERNPIKTIYVTVIGGCLFAYSSFIYHGVVQPFGELAFYIKDFAFPKTVIDSEDK